MPIVVLPAAFRLRGGVRYDETGEHGPLGPGGGQPDDRRQDPVETGDLPGAGVCEQALQVDSHVNGLVAERRESHVQSSSKMVSAGDQARTTRELGAGRLASRFCAKTFSGLPS